MTQGKTSTDLLTRLDLNTATFEELLTLPGIGPTRAQAILSARPFETLHDLRRVPGIGGKTRRTLTTLLVCPGPPQATSAPTAQDLLRRARAMRAPRSSAQPARRVIDASHLFRPPAHDDLHAPEGIVWTDGQAEAIRTIRDHLRTRPGDPFVLKGYAGTGKTTLLVEALRLAPRPPLMLAPTHKAKAVLAPKAAALGGEVRTLQSWLGYRMVIDPETGEEQFKKCRDPDRWEPPDPRVPIVLDEVSMVGEALWDDFMDVVTTYRLPCIAMGDPLQLPPVGEEISPAFASTQQGGEGYAEAELTEVMRSAGVLTSVVLQVRERIHQVAPPLIYRSAEDDDGVVEAAKDKLAMLNDFIARIKDDQDAIMLAWTNRIVKRVNVWARRQIVGPNTDPYVPGEVIVARKPYTMRSEDGARSLGRIHTETRLVVRTAEPITHPKYGDPCWRLELEQLGYQASPMPRKLAPPDPDAHVRTLHVRVPVYALDARQLKTLRRKVKQYQRDLLDARQSGESSIKVRELAYRLGHYRGAYFQSRPGYATTVHKSQGSTWEQVYVLQGDIALNSKTFERNRLLYVAYSRASKRLVVYG